MWTKPWNYTEGIVTGAGLILTGVCLQLTLGRVEWDFFAAPINYAALCFFTALMITAHLTREKVYLFKWLSSGQSAVTSIAFASILTVVMGLIRQSPSTASSAGFPWWDQMLSNWSFVLIWIWMIISLSLTILRVCIPLKTSKIPFLLSHLGLLVAIICGVLGSADLQRLKMTAYIGTPEWRATDEKGILEELPLAVELKSFHIDEYPPKLMLCDNETGQALPVGAPQNILLEDKTVSGILDEWKVTIDKLLPDSAPIFTENDVRYNEFHSIGSCSSALVSVSKEGCDTVKGWVSCGSHIFPVKALEISDKVSIVMPEREPKRYVSAVNVYTKNGAAFADTIQVNKPCRVEGWKIYQYNYDHNMGRWSEYSVFEIIRDPWLPAVYTGILMLMAGAVCMFVQFGAKKREDRQ